VAGMKLRDLIADLTDHADGWPENLNRPIYVRVGREIRHLETTYVYTGFVLVAGSPVARS
jgi:hypothetical protein